MQTAKQCINRDEYMKSIGFYFHEMIGLKMWTRGECHITDRLVHDIEEEPFTEKIEKIIKGLI
jgi:hypothetical protein